MLDCSAFLGLVLCCVIWGGVCWLRIAAGFVFALRLLVGCLWFGCLVCGCVVALVCLFICCLLFVLDNSGFVFECGWDTFWFGLLLGCVAVVDWFWVLGLVVGGFWFCVWAVLLFGVLWF